MHDASNPAQTILPRAVVAHPLNERDADCASEDLNTTPAARRYRHVVNSVRSTSTPTDHRTKTPAFNRPDEKWVPTYPATRCLSDRAPFATALSGYDASRIDLEGYDWVAGG